MSMAESPVVSVIVPVYGVERFLDKAVGSVVAQTYRNLDIVLVDDGSPDDCPAMCDRWAERDSRIRVVHKANGGLGSARNAGLDIVSGDYVAFVDSDDYVEPCMISTLVQSAVEHDADIVVCGNDNVRFDNGEYHLLDAHDMVPSVARGEDIPRLLPRMMAAYYAIPAWNKLYRRAFLESRHARFDETVTVGEDSLFNVPLYRKAGCVAVILDVLYHYVSRAGSLCNHFNPSWFADRRKVYLTAERVLRDWSPEALNMFANEFIHQTGVILGFLYEDRSGRARNLRREAIADMAGDRVLARAAAGMTPVGLRNAITRIVLRSGRPGMLAAYGATMAALKRMMSRTGRKG